MSNFKLWRVTYFLLGSKEPDQQWSMVVLAVGPIEAEEEVKERYQIVAEPYIVKVEMRG